MGKGTVRRVLQLGNDYSQTLIAVATKETLYDGR